MKQYYEKYWRGTLDKEDAIYADPPTWPEEETKRVLDAMEGGISGRVLDAGCGNGELSQLLLNENPNIDLYGFDLSETAVRMASHTFKSPSRFCVGDITALPYGSGVFDCVILIEVIEHVFDVQGLLLELNRILKPGGKLFITTTDFNLLKKMIISLFFFDRYFYPTNPHIRLFTRKTLTKILGKTGFEPIYHRWNGSYWGLMPKGQIMISRKNAL